MNTNLKTPKILFIALCIMMMIPLAFTFVPESRGKALFGVTPNKPEHFSLWRIFDHKFQAHAEEQIKQNVGFCNHAVRLYNELNYRIFHYSSAPKLVLGTDDYFYEDIYLDEYTGKDFVGEQTVKSNVLKFKKLQDSLAQKGINLLLVIEPSKAWYQPEHLPNGCQRGQHTNYQAYRKACQHYGIRYLDLNQYFTDLRKRTPHPLYNRHGIHWNSYGAWTAADTLQKFIEHETHRNMGNIIHVEDTFSRYGNDLDFDLEPPMNLLLPLRHDPVPMPVVRFVSANSKPLALIIADSYVWSLWEKGYLHHWFQDPEYWYYNNTVYPDIWEPHARYVTDDMHSRAFDRRHIVLLMLTTANLKDFGWGILNGIDISDPLF